jgi:two-component system chemotaxis sensor kinase CheA
VQDVREAVTELGRQEAPKASDSCIRVDVDLLDKVMNLVGELVLARNQILQFASTPNHAAFIKTSQRLNLITTELQESVMKTRMQPIGNVWNRFPRVVRDLATACGKSVRIEMEGRETELDRTIIEAIKDPLTHLIRNSVDHGIEPRERRLAAGKSEQGCIHLRAFHEGGQVNIEIRDDGAGVDLDRVRAKAVEKGLITADQAARMLERETLHLIFLPGFSTAAAITNVSGRGVGMDVVKTNIEKIGGAIDLQSRPGQGTTLKIKIPLTLAIIPALIVHAGRQRYAIPQVSLLELVRIDGAVAASAIEMIHDAPVYRLRGRLLPLVFLSESLELKVGMTEALAREAINIVVLQADDRQFGLVVDAIGDTEEIVVKPLGNQLKGIPIFAGATILGDGRVALILDVLGVAQRAGVVSSTRDRLFHDAAATANSSERMAERLLVVGVGFSRRVALPLSLVARLEEIQPAAVEQADGRDVVQYRGGLLRLVRLDQCLGVPADDDVRGPLSVVVVRTSNEVPVGLVVERVIDIAESREDLRVEGSGDVVTGSAVVQGRITDLLDVNRILARTVGDLVGAAL